MDLFFFFFFFFDTDDLLFLIWLILYCSRTRFYVVYVLIVQGVLGFLYLPPRKCYFILCFVRISTKLNFTQLFRNFRLTFYFA